MKRLLALLMTVALCVAFAGCDGDSGSTPEKKENAVKQETTPVKEETKPEPEEKDFEGLEPSAGGQGSTQVGGGTQ